MASRSISNYSIDDNNSNIDLEALDTDSPSDSDSQDLSSDSSESFSTNPQHRNVHSNTNRHHRNNDNNKTVQINDDSTKNQLAHTQSNKSKKSAQISFNDYSIASKTNANNTNPNTQKLPIATRQNTYNSTLSSTDASYITGGQNTVGTVSNLAASRYHNDNDDTYTFDDFYGEDYDDTKDFATTNNDEGSDDADADTYSYDYIANVKLKPGDKLKTSWAMPLQNERQFKDLQIIDEVSKLQNLNFFSKNYVENLENLKISQLGLLIDMVKLSENSFDEFYNIWDEFENKLNRDGLNTDDLSTSPNREPTNNIISSLSSNQSISPTRIVKDDNDSNIDPKDTNKMNDKKILDNTKLQIDANEEMELEIQFDINYSAGFKLMKTHKQEILKDLEKINSSIGQIDAFTKSMWTQM